MKRLMLATALAVLAAPLSAEGWGDLNAVILPHLSATGTSEGTLWLPDTPDPTTASLALGVVYEYISGSAGSTGIASGFFVKQDTGWVFAGHVSDLYGQSPRDAVFGSNAVDLTTTMLGPNEPRCCPTQATRWRIDYQSRRALRLN